MMRARKDMKEKKKAVSDVIKMAFFVLICISGVSIISTIIFDFSGEKGETIDAQFKLNSVRYQIEEVSVVQDSPLKMDIMVSQVAGEQKTNIEVIKGEEIPIDAVSAMDLSNSMQQNIIYESVFLQSRKYGMKIGANQDNKELFKGMLDEVRLYNRILTLSEVQKIYLYDGISSQPELESGLVSYWKFDESSGQTASDSSGNANVGDIINAPVWMSGKLNNAMQFDGVSNYVKVLESDSIDITGKLSISFWAYQQKPTSSRDGIIIGKFWNPMMINPYYQYGIEMIGPNPPYVDKPNDNCYPADATHVYPYCCYPADDSHINGYCVDIVPSPQVATPVFYVANDKGYRTAGTQSVNYDEWHHFVLTYEGDNATWYVDGKKTSQTEILIGKTKLDVSKETQKVFINGFLTNLKKGRIGLVGYSDDAKNAKANHDLTSDQIALSKTIDSNWFASGTTCTCCGIEKAREILTAQSPKSNGKVLIIMSDGAATRMCDGTLIGEYDPVKNPDRRAYDEVLDSTNDICNDFEKNIDIYTIGFGIKVGSSAEENMKDVAKKCGNGKYILANDVNELTKAYKDIADEVAYTYEVKKVATYALFIFKDSKGKTHTQKITNLPGALYSPYKYSFDLTNSGLEDLKEVTIYPGAKLTNGDDIEGGFPGYYRVP